MRDGVAARIVRDILRVDHAGECGAIRIYRGQMAMAKWRAPDLLDFLRETLDDECRHRDAFRQLMHDRAVLPCHMLPVWGIGGTVLGWTTGMLGRAAILVCTEAVERTVHRHLEDQLRWLANRDAGIADTIRIIQVEELNHLHFAIDHAATSRQNPGARLLDRLVAAATEMLIWCSTYGASSRLARKLDPATR